ncbi:hypothetical protein FPV67DRAFT_1666957 [Lyophyllum atratum]|nr:hypothetical protein FPV67DRAFT_1666957 [Lyophyllum atratum]
MSMLGRRQLRSCSTGVLAGTLFTDAEKSVYMFDQDANTFGKAAPRANPDHAARPSPAVHAHRHPKSTQSRLIVSSQVHPLPTLGIEKSVCMSNKEYSRASTFGNVGPAADPDCAVI